MNKPFASLAAALALSFCANASAADSLPERAVVALGAAIASQGNAALHQIERELKETLMSQLKPLLPPAPAPAAPAQTETGR